MYQTRFEGPMAVRARLYRAFIPAGISPREVDAMTPSQVAACLRLDEVPDLEGGEPYMTPSERAAARHEPPDVDRTLTRAQRRERDKAAGKPWLDDQAVQELMEGGDDS